MEYLDRDGMIHSPECMAQGDHPISGFEKALNNNNTTQLGGVRIGQVFESCPAKAFIDHMDRRIDDLVLTAYDYLEGNGVAKPDDKIQISRKELHDLIGTAENIGREFRTLAVDPEMWKRSYVDLEHGN